MKAQSTSEKIRQANEKSDQSNRSKEFEIAPLDVENSRFLWLENLDVPGVTEPPLFVPEAARKIDGVFIPRWDNKPEERAPIIELNGTSILTHQNLTAIIAAPGSGKSSFCEALCACLINPEADTLGLSIGEQIGRILYFDCERTNDDLYRSFERMHRRAGTDIKAQIDVRIYGLRDIVKHSDRLQAIEDLISFEGEINMLVIIDGAGDLVQNVNDLDEATACRYWIRGLTKKGISILTTLHPNKGTLNPRGHLGSEILRESDGIIAIQKKKDIHVITSDFEHGKTRNSKGVSGAFQWNDEVSMFTSAQIDGNEVKALKKNMHPNDIDNDKIIEILDACFFVGGLSYTQTIQNLKKWFTNYEPDFRHGDNAIKEFISMLLEMHYIISEKKGTRTIYKLHPDTKKSIELIPDLF